MEGAFILSPEIGLKHKENQCSQTDRHNNTLFTKTESILVHTHTQTHKYLFICKVPHNASHDFSRYGQNNRHPFRTIIFFHRAENYLQREAVVDSQTISSIALWIQHCVVWLITGFIGMPNILLVTEACMSANLATAKMPNCLNFASPENVPCHLYMHLSITGVRSPPFPISITFAYGAVDFYPKYILLYLLLQCFKYIQTAVLLDSQN